MAVKMAKCKYCGIQFDRNKEPFVEAGARRYAHKSCAEKYLQSFTQEELDYIALEKYIKQLFHINILSAKIKKQIKDFREEYKYTYTGIQKTLYWWFELKNNPIEKANDGIGIVPFVYQDACDYYYRLYLAHTVNNLNNEIQLQPIPPKEIYIDSPRAKKSLPRLFNLDDE